MGSSRSLAELAHAVGGRVIGDPSTVVLDVTHDSRQVGEGSLFVAVVGESHDGHDYIDQAVRAGAAALCVSRDVESRHDRIVVDDTRRSLGRLAASVHGDPSHDLAVIGVTGTNGKTTVTHFVESILQSLGMGVGLIGTIGSRVGDTALPSVRTTPEASDFQRLLANMRDAAVSHVAVEVSSHALELHRVDGTRFVAAGFTNLSQDHLDFHGSMELYEAAKRRLFRDFEIGTAVINLDDPVGRSIASSYGREMMTVGDGGDFNFEIIARSATATTFVLRTPDIEATVSAPVVGEFNVSNVTMAIALCAASGVGSASLVASLEGLRPVPGRFEVVSRPDEPTVVVDYAHTPEGISSAIEVAREISEARVLAVFGAGGDRDRAKRPMMGRAGSAADVAIVTSDNPRSESPEDIVSQVLAGASPEARAVVDRREAIEAAISESRSGDVVLILGKGHETGQEHRGVVTPFDDREVARAALNSWRKSANFDADSGSMGL